LPEVTDEKSQNVSITVVSLEAGTRNRHLPCKTSSVRRM
jgi:hypothetical protein